MGHEPAVLEGPRLAFVGVDAEINGPPGVVPDESPFDPGRESRAAPAAEVGLAGPRPGPRRGPCSRPCGRTRIRPAAIRLQAMEVLGGIHEGLEGGARQESPVRRERSPPRSLVRLQAREKAHDGVRIDRAVILVVDLEARSPVAVPQAFHRDQRERPIGRRFAGSDPQGLPEPTENGVRSGHRTAQVDADPDDVRAGRPLPEHRVERDDFPDPDRARGRGLPRPAPLRRG